MKKYTIFKNFLYLCWIVVLKVIPTAIQYDIADYLQYGGPHRIIQAFRGIGKTYITAAYACWRLYLNKDEKILIVSASKEKAVEIAAFIKRLIEEVPILQHLKPNTRYGDRDAVTSFDVAGCKPSPSPSVKVLGIFGQLTGCRASIIIADDIETSENCKTQEMRDRIKAAVTEFINILIPGGEITYLGTPHTEQTLYNVLNQERGYDLRIWVCRFLKKEQAVRYKGNLAPFCISEEKAGQPTEPERFSEETLLIKEADMGRSKFQMQFMLDPTLSDMDRYPLKCSDLIVMNLDKDKAPEKVAYASDRTKIVEDLICLGLGNDKFYKPMYISDKWLPYQGICMAIDPSGKGQDELAYAVVGMLNSQLFLLASGGLQGGYSPDNLMELTKIAKTYKVNQVVLEKNYGGGMFTALLLPYLRKYHPCSIKEVTVTKQKEQRIIDTLEPVMNQHKLIVDKDVIINDAKQCEKYPPDKRTVYQLIYQLTRITFDKGCLKHDDRLDALALAVGYWVDSMSLDVDAEIQDREEQEFLESVEKWLSYFDDSFGVSEPNWFNF